MIGFNPDGSLKLPGHMQKRRQANEEKLKNQRCIKVKRKVINFDAPKKCMLHIQISDKIDDVRFIDTIYRFFKDNSTTPSKINKVSDKEFEVEIGTDFRRCSDCNALIREYRQFLDGNIIEEKGSCTFEGRKRDFCYEDYFS